MVNECGSEVTVADGWLRQVAGIFFLSMRRSQNGIGVCGGKMADTLVGLAVGKVDD